MVGTQQEPLLVLQVEISFTGKERDAETGLDYFGARYFSGAQGRFASADAPFADQHLEDPQSWNLYTYARNASLTFVDPDGAAVIHAGKIAMGTASFRYYSKRGGFDAAAGLANVARTEVGSGQRTIRRNIEQFEQNKSSFWNRAQDSAEGGCTLGCLESYATQAVSVTLNLSFTFDKEDRLAGALISLAQDPTASSIGPNPPITKTVKGYFPGGSNPRPELLHVEIRDSAFRHLTSDQLRAVTKATVSIPIASIREAVMRAVLNEQKRRAAEQQKQSCKSGHASCTN